MVRPGSRWGRTERNRNVLWVIIGNRKSTRKRRVRGNKIEFRGGGNDRGGWTRDTRAHDGATPTYTLERVA